MPVHKIRKRNWQSKKPSYVPKQHYKRGKFVKRRAPKNSRKYIKIREKKVVAKRALNEKALNKLATQVCLMVEPSSVGVQTNSLKAMWRVVHALVAYYYPKVNVSSVADPTNFPQLGPGGFAAFFTWAIITAARKNSSTADLYPGPSTLPDFDLSWKIPNALALFITAWLRNRGPSYEIYNELPDMSNILSGTMANNITYNASTYSLSASPYGDMVQPSDPSVLPANVSEFMFNSGSATTFTLTQLIQAGDQINALVSNVGGCVAFERIFYSEGGVTRVVPYKSPVLFSVPITDGFDNRMKFQEEIAAYIIDYSAPGTISVGIIQKPYPMADQDRYVLGVVNLLSHCKCPCSSLSKDWKFPNDVRKILDPSRSSHRWHAMGRIKTLRVTCTTNITFWISLLKNICEQLCVAYGTTALTNTLALEANEMNFILQAYVFSHLMDWGWQHYTRKEKLQAGQFLNAVTSGAGPDLKALYMPENIIQCVRQWRPVVVAGQVLIPDCPLVATSTLANFITFGTGSTYTGNNIVLFQNTAAPNGYSAALAYYGLYSTNLAPSANFTAASYSLNGNTLAAINFGPTGISTTNQSPTLPIKLAPLFIADWKSKFVARSDQKMFVMEYPVLGDVAMVSSAEVYQSPGRLFGPGWLATRFDYTNGQTIIASDRVLFWKAIQYARVVWVNASYNAGVDYLPFKLTIASGDGGVLANVEAFAKDDLGKEYDNLLTGMEANPKLSSVQAKPWMALDAIVARMYDNRGGAAFEEYRGKDAIRAFLLSLKDSGVHMTSYSYNDSTSLFQPGSLSGWMSFLTGVEATYNTGKYIFTDLWKTLSGALSLKGLSLF